MSMIATSFYYALVFKSQRMYDKYTANDFVLKAKQKSIILIFLITDQLL